MLFQRRFLAGIRDGSVTLTFRAWATPRARVGAVHRLGPEDAVEVEAVDPVAPGDITRREAARAGFDDRDELLGLLGRARRVYRVRFRHVRVVDPRAALREDAGAAAVDEVVERLARIDARSRRGPWTREVLALVAAHPRRPAAQLARRADRETRAFKADVRKLKELGLTESHEVGYSLSPRGRAVLSRLGRERG